MCVQEALLINYFVFIYLVALQNTYICVQIFIDQLSSYLKIPPDFQGTRQHSHTGHDTSKLRSIIRLIKTPTSSQECLFEARNPWKKIFLNNSSNNINEQKLAVWLERFCAAVGGILIMSKRSDILHTSRL